MVAIVWTVLQTVTDRIVNDAKKTTTCDRMAIVSIVIVIRLVRARCSATVKENVNANQALPVKSVTDVKQTTLHSVNTDANLADVINAVHSTMYRHAIQKRATVRVKKMSKENGVKNANQDSLIWIWTIDSDVRHASVTGIHRNVKVQRAIQSYR